MSNLVTKRITKIKNSITLQRKIRENLARCVVDNGASLALCDQIIATLEAQLRLETNRLAA